MSHDARDLPLGTAADRPDLAAAIERLDAKARWADSLNSVLAQSLVSVDGEIVAIAPATLQRVNQFDGAGFGDVARASKTRLLAVTTESFWVVETRGATGRRASGRQIRLARIQDNARVSEFRRKSELGRKSRLLSFDHFRGSQLQTETFDLQRDELLHAFADQFNAQLAAFRVAETHAAERRERERLEAAARATSPELASTANELAKLGELLEKGLLTEEEFVRAKQRLLQT